MNEQRWDANDRANLLAQTLKLLTAARRDGGKAEAQATPELRFHQVKIMWPAQKTMREYVADALGAIVAGRESDGARAALPARPCLEKSVPQSEEPA